MAVNRVKLGSLTACSHKHDKIFYTGDKCPACRNRAAGIEIYTEYIKIANLCSTLMRKLGRTGNIEII